MKKTAKQYFWFISVAAIFVFGTILSLSYQLSDRAAWSWLLGSINDSAWEWVKPYAIVYIFWVFVELSCLRPSLARFVCSKIIFLYGFVGGAFGMLKSVTDTMWRYGVIILLLAAVQWMAYALYNSGKRCDYFLVPLLVCFGIMFFMLLFFSVCPPRWIK